MISVHDDRESGQGVSFLDLEATIDQTGLNLLHDLILNLNPDGQVLISEEVQGPDQLVVIEGEDVVIDIITLVDGKSVLEDAICVELRFCLSTSKESPPFLTELKRIKVVAEVLLVDVLKETLKLGSFKRLMQFNLILKHSDVDLSCILGRFRRVIFQVRDLVVMAEGTELSEEVDILNVESSKVLLSSILAFPL